MADSFRERLIASNKAFAALHGVVASRKFVGGTHKGGVDLDKLEAAMKRRMAHGTTAPNLSAMRARADTAHGRVAVAKAKLDAIRARPAPSAHDLSARSRMRAALKQHKALAASGKHDEAKAALRSAAAHAQHIDSSDPAHKHLQKAFKAQRKQLPPGYVMVFGKIRKVAANASAKRRR